MDVCMYVCMYGCMDVWMYGCMCICMYVLCAMQGGFTNIRALAHRYTTHFEETNRPRRAKIASLVSEYVQYRAPLACVIRSVATMPFLWCICVAQESR